jgi:K+-sensing histidine kinase KdpD
MSKHCLRKFSENICHTLFAIPISGEIRANRDTLKDSIIIHVTDAGIGIPKEQETIFEEFYELGDQERDHNNGLGFGLAII